MRHIEKRVEPESIREWRAAQESLKINLGYKNGFGRQKQLRKELITEQFGLCAFTGAPLDDRLDGLADQGANLAFQPHIEHIKSQKICREELEAEHGDAAFGTVLGEDMDYRNMVAALEVKNKPPAKSEIFGAAAHGDEMLPVTPVQQDCESKFCYDDNGGVDGASQDAKATITLLKLDHKTPTGWRKAAIQGYFLNEDGDFIDYKREDIERIVEQMETPANGQLPEFCFCIKSYAQSLL